MPVTFTGEALTGVKVPFPSSPWKSKPQHITVPAAVTTQVCAPPAATARIAVGRPVITTGPRPDVDAAGPSSRYALSPQHSTPPPDIRAQVSTMPAEIAAALPGRPVTSTGTLVSFAVPLPSRPPQHHTSPALVRAQVW